MNGRLLICPDFIQCAYQLGEWNRCQNQQEKILLVAGHPETSTKGTYFVSFRKVFLTFLSPLLFEIVETH